MSSGLATSHTIARTGCAPLRDFLGGLIERRLFAAGDDDMRIALGEALRERTPDAAAAAGHEHDLIGYGE